MIEIKDKERTVIYDDSRKMQKAVFDKVIKYFFECNQFSGEGIMQNDNALINASTLMSEIADDIINFKIIYDYE